MNYLFIAVQDLHLTRVALLRIQDFGYSSHKGLVRSDMSKPALIFFFFHCKSTHKKIHCENSSC
jgi:hypothetical protein